MSMFASMSLVVVLIDDVLFTIGGTPFMMSAQSGDVPLVKYFLDHGGDLMKSDDKGCTVLHHAVDAGSAPHTHTHTNT